MDKLVYIFVIFVIYYIIYFLSCIVNGVGTDADGTLAVVTFLG